MVNAAVTTVDAALCKLGDQLSTAPSGVDPQSSSRQCAAISLAPAKSAEALRVSGS